MRVGRGIAVIALAVLAFWVVPLAALAQTSTSASPTSEPSVSATPTPTPTPDPTATSTPSDSPNPTESPSTNPSPSVDPNPQYSPVAPSGGAAGRFVTLGPRAVTRTRTGDARKHDGGRRQHDRGWAPNPRWGAYSTERLVAAARRLERRGVARPTALRRVFAPFPVAGLAVWSDTWGAPRYAGGYHPHHGQDLLCAEGTPLLAVADGVVRLGSDPLGGTTIELTLHDGSFWYYAHLSRYANGLTDGERVHTGDVIGACGETGDATVPHLHFSYFTAGLDARNPMHALLGWLHRAERRVGAKPSNGHGVPTPPVAELATPPEMHPRPAMAATPWVAGPAFVAVAPSSGPVSVPVYAAMALLLAPLLVFASSRRARSWALRRVAA
jgi:murein DD-endopeptidase MepM/ murein hydrolase activator NlpD